MFAGLTGSGKSAAMNFFLRDLRWGVLSITGVTIATATATICGKTVKIIDTHSLFDSNEVYFGEFCKTLTLAKDGIHAVAFVMANNMRYTVQHIKAIQKIKGLGPFLFVLLTHANNEGVTKAATDEYIQQILSHPRCPGDIKNLMELVKNRVIMLESYTSAENYHAQKSKEFIMMIEDIHKSNAYKIYTNSILQHTAQVYEKAKLQQQAEIRIVTKLLWSNEEKIQQLKKQAKDSTNSEATINIGDKIVALELENETHESKLKEIKDEEYLEKVTNKILQAEMENIPAKNTGEKSIGIIGAIVGSIFKGSLGPSAAVGAYVVAQQISAIIGAPAEASARAQIGTVIGAAYDECKQQ